MGSSHLLAPLPTVVALAWNWVQGLDDEVDGHNLQVHNHLGGMLDPMPQRLNLQRPPPFPCTVSHKNAALKMHWMHGRSSVYTLGLATWDAALTTHRDSSGRHCADFFAMASCSADGISMAAATVPTHPSSSGAEFARQSLIRHRRHP